MTKRQLEFKKKKDDAMNRTIGKEADQMYTIELLATSPKYQGQGYGSTLAQSVIKQVLFAQSSSCILRFTHINRPILRERGFI